MQLQPTARFRRGHSEVAWAVNVVLALLVGGGLFGLLAAFWGR